MKKNLLIVALTAMAALVGCTKEKESEENIIITQDDLKEAFYYTFPLMIMDATEAVETNAETFVPGVPRAPVNQLIHAIKMADATSTSVVTPNVDTYYTCL